MTKMAISNCLNIKEHREDEPVFFLEINYANILFSRSSKYFLQQIGCGTPFIFNNGLNAKVVSCAFMSTSAYAPLKVKFTHRFCLASSRSNKG